MYVSTVSLPPSAAQRLGIFSSCRSDPRGCLTRHSQLPDDASIRSRGCGATFAWRALTGARDATMRSLRGRAPRLVPVHCDLCEADASRDQKTSRAGNRASSRQTASPRFPVQSEYLRCPYLSSALRASERAALEPHVPTGQIIVREQPLNRRSAGPTVSDYLGRSNAALAVAGSMGVSARTPAAEGGARRLRATKTRTLPPSNKKTFRLRSGNKNAGPHQCMAVHVYPVDRVRQDARAGVHVRSGLRSWYLRRLSPRAHRSLPKSRARRPRLRRMKRLPQSRGSNRSSSPLRRHPLRVRLPKPKLPPSRL
jgi:hypothetical protein